MNRMTRFALAGLSIGLSAFAMTVPAVAHAGDGAIVSRDYAWTSGQLTLDVPADVVFRPGPTWRMTISAPARALNLLIVHDGRIAAKSHACFSLIPFCVGFGTDLNSTVHVMVTGPALRAIRVDGAAKIQLDQMHQKRLALKIDGSATVHGTGSVGDLLVRINGAGDVHLGRMTEQRAHVRINGTGKVSVAPTDSVSVHINGVGNVRLHSNPAHVSSVINGIGEVTRVTGR